MIKTRILIEGIDKTDEISKFEETDTNYNIYYENKNEPYKYSKKNNKVIIQEISIGPFDAFTQIANSIKIGDFSALGKYYESIDIKENSLIHKYLNGTPFATFDDDKPLIFPFRFNMSQMDAIMKVFKNELSIIQGPPGTGKTQTILNIIANILIRGGNVAVVSNNNAAVENVMDKLIKNGYESIFALLGSKTNQEEFIRNQVLDKVNYNIELEEEEFEGLRKRLSNLTDKMRNLMEIDQKKRIIMEQLGAIKLERDYYNNTHQIKDLGIRHISFVSLGYDKILDFLIDHQIMITENEKLTLKNKFKLLLKYGVYKFKYLKDNDFEIITRFQQMYYDLKIKDLESELDNCEKTLKSQKFDDIKDEHYEVSQTIFHYYLSLRFKEKKKYVIDTYKKEFNDFINDYPVVLSTAYSITYSTMKDFQYDYVIIDEASTLDLVKAMLPLSCAKKVVIVGDQKQLPHIPSETDICFDNEAYDYKTKSIMDSLDFLYGDTIERTLLKEHYRCHPDIIRFCNIKYYNGDLIVYTNSSNSNAINVIKTSEGNHMRCLSNGNKGTFNQRELEELENLINNQCEYNLELCSDNLCDIGLVSPYRLQVEYANKINSAEIEKDTVHKYQGREKQIIIFSTVLDNSALSKVKMKFVNDSQMINVAVSRAEKQLILITSADVFYKNGNEIGDLIKYIEYHDLKNVEQGRVISVFDLLYKEYSDRLLKRKEAMEKVKKNIKFDSEKIIYSIIEELLEEDSFQCYSFTHEVRLSDIFLNLDKCTDIEKKFIKQPRSSVDFIIYNKFDNSPAMGIEVDGTEFHLNNPDQLERDKKKDGIFKKFDIPLIRLQTHASVVEENIRHELSKITDESGKVE